MEEVLNKAENDYPLLEKSISNKLNKITFMDFYKSLSKSDRNDIIAQLIHVGINPSDVSIREVVIYYSKHRDLFEKDSKVVQKGVAEGFGG